MWTECITKTRQKLEVYFRKPVEAKWAVALGVYSVDDEVNQMMWTPGPEGLYIVSSEITPVILKL